MNFSEVIKNDIVLSAYDYGTVYQVLIRLDNLGLICNCKSKEKNNVQQQFQSNE